ncbi:hypothetical protein [Actinomadura madurae]|uniref:hypothetical protein n=1 Tax=Actinomadura madurae TaxID=1993 RepID=UPI0035576B68
MLPRSQSSQPGRPRRLQRLDDRPGEPLEEHAAEQLAARGRAGLGVHDLDAGAERAEQGGDAGGAVPGGQHRRAQPAAGHRRHDRDVGERDAALPGDAVQLPLQARRPGVQVRPDRAVPDPADPGLEGRDRVVRAVDAQHEVGAGRGLPSLPACTIPPDAATSGS